MPRVIFLSSFFSCLMMGTLSHGQAVPVYSLETALEKSVAHSYDIQLQDLYVSSVGRDLASARMAFLPSISGLSSNGGNFGRFIDPYTNQYTNQPIFVNSTSINANASIYNGNQLNNKVKVEQLNLEIEKLNLQQKQLMIKGEVLKVYSDISLNKDLIAIVEGRLKQVNLELERNRELVNAGSVNETELMELEYERSAQERILLKLINSLELSSLQLGILMGTGSDTHPSAFENVDVTLPLLVDTAGQKLEKNISYSISMLSLQKEQLNIKLTKAQFYPTLSFHGSVFSGYSSGRLRLNENNTGYVNYPFASQFSDNISQQVFLVLEVPIFNRFKTSNAVKKASINYQMATVKHQQLLSNMNERLVMAKKNLELDYTNAMIEQKKLNETQKIFDSYKARFDSGRIDATEYMIRKEQLYTSLYNAVVSKYTFYLNSKLFELNFMNKTL